MAKSVCPHARNGAESHRKVYGAYPRPKWGNGGSLGLEGRKVSAIRQEYKTFMTGMQEVHVWSVMNER